MVGKSMLPVTVLTAVALVLAGPAVAETIEISWAEELSVSENPPLDPEHILGAPDFEIAEFSPPDSELTVRDFEKSLAFYDLVGFAGLVSLLPEELVVGDVICFEHNGTPSTSFEGGTWTFSSGDDWETHEVVHGEPDDSFAKGFIRNQEYADFFGIPNPYGDHGCVAYVLFDLTQVDPRAPDLSVTIARGPLLEQTPDPDVVGAIVPEPGTLLLLVPIVAAIARRRAAAAGR